MTDPDPDPGDLARAGAAAVRDNDLAKEASAASAPFSVSLRRRTAAERLRYLAGLLHRGEAYRLAVAVSLEDLARELEGSQAAARG
jgi:hypothetical protein